MDLSHHTSDLDPSSLLGFGSALSLLEAPDEVARLLTGALRSMDLADLQAVVLREQGEAPTRVLGSVGTRPLPDPVAGELRSLEAEPPAGGEGVGSPSHRRVDVQEETHPALAHEGVRRLLVVRLGTIDEAFGVAVAGRTGEATHTPMQVSTLQMLAAQVSMALHRIRINRKRAAQEEALQKSEARYRELYENAPVAYLSVDGDGVIRMANQRAADLLAAGEASLCGQTLTHFCVDTAASEEAVRRLSRCIEGQERLYDEEVKVCRADGDPIWVSLSIQPIERADGSVECLVMMVDITERVHAEETLRATRDELEERVQERTAELERTNRRLQKQAERLTALRDIDQAILSAESPEEIASAALQRARRIIPFESASVAATDWAEEAVHVLATSEKNVLDGPTTLPLDEVYLSDNLRAGETEVVSVEDYAPVPEAEERMREMGLRSILCLPMVVEDEVIGVMHVGRTRPEAFTADDRTAGQELADHLAVAVRQGQLLEEVQARRERLEERVRARTAELREANAALTDEVEERKRVEQALRESEERLTRIIDSAIDAIISVRPNLEITLFNDAAEDIFRCGAAEAECTSLDAFLTDPFEALVRRHIDRHQNASGDGAAPESDGRYLAAPEGLKARRRDGETFPVEATLCPVRLPDEDQYLLILRDLDELKQAEEELEQLQSERTYLQEELRSEYNFDEIVGASAPMQAVFDAVEQVADTDTTVLVTGETGTGKELVARALHDRSGRADQVFVKVNCAALPEDLIESELFGHEKGAFTGATERREGRFELADGGTLLLDEIGELPLGTQAKLLRALQHQQFERVGGSDTIEVDTRILAATNRDLEAEVEAGRFRDDLYYRLNIFPIELPPLRERTGDVPLLADHFCELYASRTGKDIQGLSPSARAVLEAYDWPGNVRELKNIIERAVILASGDRLRTEHLSIAEGGGTNGTTGFRTLAEAQRDHIERALSATDGVVGGDDGAAQLLDVKRTTLLSRMDRLGIDPDEYRP